MNLIAVSSPSLNPSSCPILYAPSAVSSTLLSPQLSSLNCWRSPSSTFILDKRAINSTLFILPPNRCEHCDRPQMVGPHVQYIHHYHKQHICNLLDLYLQIFECYTLYNSHDEVEHL